MGDSGAILRNLKLNWRLHSSSCHPALWSSSHLPPFSFVPLPDLLLSWHSLRVLLPTKPPTSLPSFSSAVFCLSPRLLFRYLWPPAAQEAAAFMLLWVLPWRVLAPRHLGFSLASLHPNYVCRDMVVTKDEDCFHIVFYDFCSYFKWVNVICLSACLV